MTMLALVLKQLERHPDDSLSVPESLSPVICSDNSETFPTSSHCHRQSIMLCRIIPDNYDLESI